MSILDAIRRRNRRQRLGSLAVWLFLVLFAALMLAVAGEFPDLETILP